MHSSYQQNPIKYSNRQKSPSFYSATSHRSHTSDFSQNEMSVSFQQKRQQILQNLKNFQLAKNTQKTTKPHLYQDPHPEQITELPQ